ncbi:hypothetical protein SETIT_6G095600v2 [Setaria italica]|uniref:Endonuclease/exonuclease/phosphatase domain-containing protein n=1 Tax=Setaria italica TaxID=4555 RepID=A0A368RK58_SETIT|nr:hypothetical protein SETIT_6G095600v2 [Setaria italica]
MKPKRNPLGHNPPSDALYQNPVRVLIDKSLKDGVVNVRRQGDRIILVRLVVGDMVLNVISAYVPQVGHDKSAKRLFWEDLDSLVRTVPSSKKLFIGDLNGHVGTTSAGFKAVHGGFGYGSRNQEEVLDFAVAFDLMIANTFFRKRRSHLETFKEDKRACLDCKVIQGECVVCQHKLVVVDFHFQMYARRDKQAKIARTKWWNLKEEMSEVFKERWNEEVQRTIKEKKEYYRRLFHDRSVDNIEKYEAISVAKGRAYEDIYQQLGTKEGEKDIYRMAKVRERKTRDSNQEDEIKHRWQEYFDKLFNGENENTTLQLDDFFDDTNRHFAQKIQESEVGEALKRMKSGKAMGPDGIPIKVWRCLGDIAIVWLTKLLNHIFRSNKMPKE